MPLLKVAAAPDFASDAYAHYKFIGYTKAATKQFYKVGPSAQLDEGFAILSTTVDAKAFIKACGQLRFWDRPDGA